MNMIDFCLLKAAASFSEVSHVRFSAPVAQVTQHTNDMHGQVTHASGKLHPLDVVTCSPSYVAGCLFFSHPLALFSSPSPFQ